jgi:hypothetical protein
MGLAAPAAAQMCTYSIRNSAIGDMQLNRTLRCLIAIPERETGVKRRFQCEIPLQ